MEFHFNTKSISNIYTKLCGLVSQRRHKTYLQEFYSVSWVTIQEWDLGLLGVNNLSMGIYSITTFMRGSRNFCRGGGGGYNFFQEGGGGGGPNASSL